MKSTPENQYKIIHKSNQNVLFGATAGNIYPMPWNKGNFQQWKFERLSDGYYKIIQKQSGYVLDGNAKGNVYLMPWNGGDFQKWDVQELISNSNKPGIIMQKATGRLLSLVGSKHDKIGTTPVGSGSPTYNWTLTLLEDGYYKVAQTNIEYHGVVLDGNVDLKISTTKWANQPEEKWIFEDMDNGYFRIINTASNFAIDGMSDKPGKLYLSKPDQSDSQLWSLEGLSEGYLKIIQKSSGQVIDGNNAGDVYRNPWNAGNSFQMWNAQLVEEASIEPKAEVAPIPWGNIGLPAGASTVSFLGEQIELDPNYKLWDDSPGGSSKNTIAARAFKGQLHTAYQGTGSQDGKDNNDIWQNVSKDPIKSWPANTRLNNVDSTGAAPCMVDLNDQLYLFFKANDDTNRLYVSNLEDGKWSAGKKINEVNSADGPPSATSFNEQLFLAYMASNKSGHIRICKNHEPLESWPQDWVMNEADFSDTPPCIISFKKKLYVFYTYKSTIYMASSGDGIDWENGIAIKDYRNTSIKTSGSLSVCTLGGTLFLIYKDQLIPSVLHLTHTTNPAQFWSKSQSIQLGDEDATISPSLCTFNDRLYIFKCNSNKDILLSENGYDLGVLLADADFFGSNAPTQLIMTAELLQGHIQAQMPSLDAHKEGMFCIVKNPDADPQSPMSNEIIAISGGQKNLVHLKWNPKAKSLSDKTGWEMECIKVEELLRTEDADWQIDRVEAVYQGSQLLVIITDFGGKNHYGYNNFGWYSQKPKSPVDIKSRVLMKNEGGKWELDTAIQYSREHEHAKYNYGYLRFHVDPKDEQSYVFGARCFEDVQYNMWFYNYKNTPTPNESYGINAYYQLDTATNAYQNIMMIGTAQVNNSNLVELFTTSPTNDLAYATVKNNYSYLQTLKKNDIHPVALPAGVGYPATVQLLKTHEDKNPNLPVKAKSFLVSDATGHLVYGFQSAAETPGDSKFTTRLLQGRKVIKIWHNAFGQNADGMYRIFLLDSHNKLWLLRQTGENEETGEMIFADAFVYLGASFNSISCPKIMVEDAEVYGVVQQEATDQSFLYELHCTRVSKIWVKEPIRVPDNCATAEGSNPDDKGTTGTPPGLSKLPSASPFYYTEIIAKDANGTTYAGYDLEIRASSRTTVFINGYLHRFDRFSPAYVRTNGQGKVILESYAKGLNTAHLMVYGEFMGVDAEGNKNYHVINPGNNAHNRLAGNEDLTVKKNGKFTEQEFSSQTLYDQGILKKGDDSFTAEDADNMVGLVKDTAAVMARASSGSSKRSVEGTGQNYITNPESYDFSLIPASGKRSITSSGFTIQLAGGPVKVTANSPADSSSGKSKRGWLSDMGDAIWSWAEGEVEEVWDEAKEEFQAIEKIVVEIENEITIAIHTAEGLFNTIVASTVEQAGALVEKIFQVLAKAVDIVEDVMAKVVQFLLKLFHWDDILIVKEKIETILNDINSIAGTQIIDPMKNLFIENADHLENLITENFDKVKSQFSGKSFASSGAPGASSNPYYKMHEDHGVRMNYVSNHYHNADPVETAVSYTGGNSLYELLEKEIASFSDLFSKFQADVTSDMQNSTNVLEASIDVLLDSAKVIILGIVETIKNLITTLFDSGKSNLAALFDFLNSEVPILSWLFEMIGLGTKVTWMDIFSLMLAVPLYLVSVIEAALGNPGLKNALLAAGNQIPGNPWVTNSQASKKRENPLVNAWNGLSNIAFIIDYIFLAGMKTWLDARRIYPLSVGTGEGRPLTEKAREKAENRIKEKMASAAQGALVYGFMGWLFTIPYISMNNLRTKTASTKDKLLVAKSAMIFLTVSFNTAMYFLYRQNGGSSLGLVIKKVQAIGSSFLGLSNMVLGGFTAWKIIEEDGDTTINRLKATQVVLRPFPTACQGILVLKDVKVYGVSVAVVVPIIDVASDLAVAGVQAAIYHEEINS